jgi:uncharacterized protein YoxC
MAMWYPWLATLSDTLLVKQVPAPVSPFQAVATVASGIVSIVLCLVVLSLIPLALVLRAKARQAGSSLSKIQSDVGPLLSESMALLADLRAIATSVRADVATVHQAVTDADAGVRAVARRAERRLAEVDAMVGVLQDEIEDAFVATAAVARGVRAGAVAFGRGRNGRDRDGATDSASADDGDLSESEVADYGSDSEGEAPGRARPRIRSRGGDRAAR